MLIADRHVRVIDAATGELLRDRSSPPTATTSPSADHPAHHPDNDNDPNRIRGSSVRDVLSHHSQRARRESNPQPSDP
jgi:hypothetical protein